MPTRYGMPTLYEATPYPGAPVAFHRRWDTAEGAVVGYDKEGRVVSEVPLGVGPFREVLDIYGYSCRSTYTEDLSAEDHAFENGSFPSMCFSEAEPDGEYGFTPLGTVEEITVEELERALRALGVEWVKR
jgi:hypothetical protein